MADVWNLAEPGRPLRRGLTCPIDGTVGPDGLMMTDIAPPKVGPSVA